MNNKPRQCRGKRKDNGELIEGWYIKTLSPETHWILKDKLYCSDIRLGLDEAMPKHLQGCYKVFLETVEQLTED